MKASKNSKKGNKADHLIVFISGTSMKCAHYLNTKHEREVAREHFVQSAAADANREARKVEAAFQSIYENIKTISRLQSVINIDRRATNLGLDGRGTLQQVYNKLANSVSVSEVYILPVDFDPEKIDPVTAEPEEPIIMFYELIRHGDGMEITSTPGDGAAFTSWFPLEQQMMAA